MTPEQAKTELSRGIRRTREKVVVWIDPDKQFNDSGYLIAQGYIDGPASELWVKDKFFQGKEAFQIAQYGIRTHLAHATTSLHLPARFMFEDWEPILRGEAIYELVEANGSEELSLDLQETVHACWRGYKQHHAHEQETTPVMLVEMSPPILFGRLSQSRMGCYVVGRFAGTQWHDFSLFTRVVEMDRETRRFTSVWKIEIAPFTPTQPGAPRPKLVTGRQRRSQKEMVAVAQQNRKREIYA